ncbi:MAG: N-acetyl-gamma-glutamyl-phosphate reductase [Aureispira sp.]|nr:N-acetyl-gamma-glutamyl-phosphate reductase [Aureispira sp.]
MTPIRVGVVGATGSTGVELISLLLRHPAVELVALSSVNHVGKIFSELFPKFRGRVDLPLVETAEIKSSSLDLIFLAVPHGVGMSLVKEWASTNFKIIDLSADFRLLNAVDYKQWYKWEHSYSEGLKRAVYGLPELFRDQIAAAQLVANPGCQPTCALLALAPLLQNGWVELQSIIIDAKSGASGAGSRVRKATQFMNIYNNVSARSLKKHRHTVEIESYLSELAGESLTLQFTPHLLPIDRGILMTIYAKPSEQFESMELLELYQQYYKNKPFVEICQHPPMLRDVQHINNCHIYPTYDERTGNILIVAAIDNLLKGSAGQAVQNMNVMMGWEETLGLSDL